MTGLECAIAGCGEEVVTIYRGFALCDQCLDWAYAVSARTAEGMERAIEACREIDEDQPGRVGWGPDSIHPSKATKAQKSAAGWFLPA